MKSPTINALRGVRVLVGRARHQAGALSAELRRLGAQVIEIPFIEIRRPRSYRPLDSALRNLDTYDWLVLTSVNGVEAMWERLENLRLPSLSRGRKGSSRAGKNQANRRPSDAERRLRIAAIGPATRRAIEQRGVEVDVMPKEYVAESVVRSLKKRVKGKRVLLVRAKVARDVIPRELRHSASCVDVVEAYETVVPRSSRQSLRAVLRNPRRRPDVITFTSSSTVKNFATLMGREGKELKRGEMPRIRNASIGPVTSATLRALGLRVDIAAKEFTIPGLVQAILRSLSRDPPER